MYIFAAMKRTTAIISILTCMVISLQAQTISMMSGDKPLPIEVEQTQTEIKPGWKIVDVQLKSKVIRYLWGAKAQMLSDDNTPRFEVDTDTLLLSNLVLIKLKKHSQYRTIPKPQISDNQLTFVDLQHFSITASKDDDKFLIQPLQPLESGEYILTWFGTPGIGDFKDWLVWPFSVK